MIMIMNEYENDDVWTFHVCLPGFVYEKPQISNQMPG